jgi:hypothetical protein
MGTCNGQTCAVHRCDKHAAFIAAGAFDAGQESIARAA